MARLEEPTFAVEGEPAQSSSPLARAISSILSISLSVLGLVWAGGFLLDFGVPLQNEQVLAAAVGLSLGLVFLNTR